MTEDTIPNGIRSWSWPEPLPAEFFDAYEGRMASMDALPSDELGSSYPKYYSVVSTSILRDLYVVGQRSGESVFYPTYKFVSGRYAAINLSLICDLYQDGLISITILDDGRYIMHISEKGCAAAESIVALDEYGLAPVSDLYGCVIPGSEDDD